MATQMGTRSWLKGLMAKWPVKNPFLSTRADVSRFARLLLVGEHLLQAGKFGGIVADQFGDQRMLRRKLQRRGAVDGVDARGEDGDLALRSRRRG